MTTKKSLYVSFWLFDNHLLLQEPVQVAPSKTEGLSFYFQMTTAGNISPT